MSKHHTSVATLAIVILVTVATLLLGVLGFTNYLLESRDAHAALESESSITANQLAAGLALPLWNFDRPQVDKIIESAMQAPDVYGVIVEQLDVSAPGGKAIHMKLRGSPGTSSATMPRGLIAQEREIQASGERLGSIKLFMTTRLVDQRLRRSLLLVAGRIILFDVILVASLYLLLRRTVLLPLRSVEQYASTVSSGAGDRPVLATRRFSGEIESLRLSIEKMITLLDDRYHALEKSQAMIKTILNSVPQAIFWKDRQSVYLGCNQVYATAVGARNPDDVIGKTDFDFWPRNDADKYRAQDQEVMETTKSKRHIVEVAHMTDGSERWVDATKVPLVDPNGQVVGVLGVYDDITEARATEKALLDSEKMRSIAGLAAGMAHEINNPLAGILQSTEVIMNRISPQVPANQSVAEQCGTTVDAIDQYLDRRGVRALLQTISTCSERAASIVANMLNFSRTNRSGVAAHKINDLLDKTLELARSDYDPKRKLDFCRITVKRDYSGDLPPVECDAVEIQQVVLNLLQNSAQAMAAAAPLNEQCTITVRVRRAGDGVCIEIHDNGPGIPPDVLDRIFDPFFTTKSPGQGTGLGLSVSKFIITQNHAGRIEAESKRGQGATFRIYLPFKHSVNAVT